MRERGENERKRERRGRGRVLHSIELGVVDAVVGKGKAKESEKGNAPGR